MAKLAGLRHFRSIDKRLRLSISYYQCDGRTSTMQFTAHTQQKLDRRSTVDTEQTIKNTHKIYTIAFIDRYFPVPAYTFSWKIGC